jgi:hypothetical protein
VKKSEIIKQAKYYFGKNRSSIKKLVLSYEFKGKNYRRWKNEIGSIIPNPNEIKFNLSDDVILWIKDNKANEIDWNWIGDLSWTIDIVLNPNIEKGYDWDKKLALNCNGTARVLSVSFSEVIPCFTYDCYYMTYSKKENYYEFGPILNWTLEEKNILRQVKSLLIRKGFQYVDKQFSEKKFKDLYSDTNSNGNASLYDVLFSDITFYTTEIKRFCDKDIIEKSGNKFRWTELYTRNGVLKERTESRWTSGGDYFKVVLDKNGYITEVSVTRKEIERKKQQQFRLDILDSIKKRKKIADREKNSR